MLKTACVVACAAVVSLFVAGGVSADHHAEAEKAINVYYLEYVTTEADATVEMLAAAHGVEFTPPIAELGGSRVAQLAGGASVGVRAPMHGGEKPVTRAYLLVDDLQAAIKTATDAGGQVMVPPMAIEGFGKFALYQLGGVEHGLWEN